ncbi:MAG: hypothetical protein EHM26_00875, partial [Desulfobacteraceae bacterium]
MRWRYVTVPVTIGVAAPLPAGAALMPEHAASNDAYSLGLLLAEMGKHKEALGYLERAAKGLPERSRIQYNLGLLLQVLQRDSEAEAALQKSLGLEPTNMDYLYALADFYIKRNRLSEAKKVAETMVAAHPDQRIGRELLDVIERR